MDVEHLFVTLWWNLAPVAGLTGKRNLVKGGAGAGWGWGCLLGQGC